MSNEIRVALVGVGNCASALFQGLLYYEQIGGDIGLMHRDLGGYDVTDIKPVVAFDVNAAKVGKDLADAIFAPPNNAYDVPNVEIFSRGVGEHHEVVVGLVLGLQLLVGEAVGAPLLPDLLPFLLNGDGRIAVGSVLFHGTRTSWGGGPSFPDDWTPRRE